MVKSRKLLGGVAFLFVASAVAAWWINHSSRARFQTVRVERGEVRSSISATGACNAVVTVQVGSQVSGNIKALYADFNTKVTKGQLVALIDPEIYQARVDQARANLASADAAVLNAQAAIEKTGADIAGGLANVATGRANVAHAVSGVKDATVKLDRRVTLAGEKILAKEDLDTAQATYDQAVAQQEAAQAQLDAAQKQVESLHAQRGVALAQLASAQASVGQTRAALAQAQADLDHTRIVAPVEGTVVARHMDVGQTVAASFQAPDIFDIAQDLTKMQVDTNVDEADIGKVRLGQNAAFTVDAYPGRMFRGQVSQIRQAPINVQNVVTYDVVVAVPNPDLKLFPGMTANLRMVVDQADGVLKIPNAALRFHPSDTQWTPAGSVHAAGFLRTSRTQEGTVWVTGTNGSVRAVDCRLGISDGSYTAVESGDLREGDSVIVAELGTGKASPKAAPKGRGPGF